MPMKMYTDTYMHTADNRPGYKQYCLDHTMSSVCLAVGPILRGQWLGDSTPHRHIVPCLDQSVFLSMA